MNEALTAIAIVALLGALAFAAYALRHAERRADRAARRADKLLSRLILLCVEERDRATAAVDVASGRKPKPTTTGNGVTIESIGNNDPGEDENLERLASAMFPLGPASAQRAEP